MRGLKQIKRIRIVQEDIVASFTDAWIETHNSFVLLFVRCVASFTDAWIETDAGSIYVEGESRIFYRCVD